MPAPIFVDLENGGGHVRIDPPHSNSSSIRLIITLPRQFNDAGETIEQSTTLDCWTTQRAASQLRDALTYALDRDIHKLMGS